MAIRQLSNYGRISTHTDNKKNMFYKSGQIWSCDLISARVRIEYISGNLSCAERIYIFPRQRIETNKNSEPRHDKKQQVHYNFAINLIVSGHFFLSPIPRLAIGEPKKINYTNKTQ